MKVPTQFKLSAGLGQSQIEAILARHGTFSVESPHAQSWSLYDTFDRRLFAKSLTLQWSGSDLVLRALPAGEIRHQLPLSAPPRFALAMRESDLKAQLSAIIDMRALLRLTIVHTCSCDYRILNKEQKTVARLTYTEVRPEVTDGEPPLFMYLTVWPLRGYAKQAGRLARHLRGNLDLTRTDEEIRFAAFQATRRSSAAYSGKLDVYLHPNMPAGEATRLILRRLLEMMQANEAGLKADLDTEFLHDYRIAVRRTRSALSQIRKVLPKARINHFKQEFRILGRLTNDLRDLDVYLLAEADYRAVLPDAMQADITPLFDALRSRRAEALAKVVAGLESESYVRLVAEWNSFLSGPAGENGAERATLPIIDLARRDLTRQYRSIVKSGNAILKHTEDELLHALRIECKKLRYLLEFFSSLFPPKEMNRVSKQLKRLQNNLGTFTDSTLQREYLLAVAGTLDIDEALARQALVATGYLVESTDRKREEAKAHFAATFKKFASPGHQKEFHRVFSRGKKVKS